MYKDKPIILNILLAIWQLPQILIGLIFLAIFHNFTVYTNPVSGITVWNINTGKSFGTACFSTGPIILTCDNVREVTLRHETGHSKQSIYLGPLFHIVVSLPSICLFWYRRIKKKDSTWYYAHYPENWAEKLGGTKELRDQEN